MMNLSDRYQNYDDEKLLSIVAQGRAAYAVSSLQLASKLLAERGLEAAAKTRISDKFRGYDNDALFRYLKTPGQTAWPLEEKTIQELLADRGLEETVVADRMAVDEQRRDLDLVAALDAQVLPIDTELLTVEDERARKKALALTEITVNLDRLLKREVRRIAAGELIAFDREIVWAGKRMLQIITGSKELNYIVYDKRKLRICNEYVVISDVLDLIVMDHARFTDYYRSIVIGSKQLSEHAIPMVASSMIEGGNRFGLQIKDVYSKNGKVAAQLNTVELEPAAKPLVQIGRLRRWARFYSVEPRKSRDPWRVFTEGGTPGIIISRESMWQRTTDEIDTTVNNVVFAIAALIAVIVMVICYLGGYLVVGGALLFIPFIIIYLIIGLPLAWLLRYRAKRR